MTEPSDTQASDDALLERLRAGEDQAVAEIVERYAPRVLRFGMKLCRDEEDARDVMQDTLLAAARGLRDFRGQSRLVTWLYSIARSFCIKRRTRGGAGVVHEPLDPGSDSEPADVAPSPDEQVAGRELGALLERAIRALEPGQREVLVLRDIEGLTAPEVAEALGISVDAVKSRLHRARSALRDRILPALDVRPESPMRPGCPDVVELLSRHLEGDMTAEACKQMEAHVERCDHCRARCDSLRKVLAACSAAPAPELPPELKATVVDQIRQTLRAVGRASH